MQGKMIAVLPFVGKVLEATKDSKSYRPSNPWVMGIMALLAEIYAMDRLKLNLKFEIEMVFRNLGLQVNVFCLPSSFSFFRSLQIQLFTHQTSLYLQCSFAAHIPPAA